MKNVMRYFDPQKFHPVVATLSPEPTCTFINDFRSLRVPVIKMGMSRVGSLVSGARHLRRVVSAIKPDLVHSHGLRADILVASAGLDCPIVSTIHSDLGQDYRFAYGPLVGPYATAREYAALRRFDGVNAVSAPLADLLSELGIAARVIINGVEFADYYPATDPESIRALRTRFGWPPGAVVVLHTGVLRSLKNPIAVVRGFRASKMSRRGFLVFAGDGAQRAECEKAAGSASNIVFLNKRKDVPDLLRAADILISASSSEGLGTALLEGCVCGIRVLATDIPAHRYIQKMFPDQMRIFGRGDSASVHAALDSLGEEDARKKFLPSPSTLEMISTRRMSRQYQEFYSDILRSTNCATAGQARMV
jgi:glycosyltransferase involved in cell wall biosynthesis